MSTTDNPASTSTSTPTAAPTPQPALASSRRWRTWLTVVLSAVIFLGGGVVGSGLTAMHVGRQAKEAIQHPDLTAPRVARRLQGLFDLTEEQMKLVQQVVERHYTVIRQARAEMLEVVDPELEAIGSEIAALLPPDRARRFEQHFRTFREEWFPQHTATRRGR